MILKCLKKRNEQLRIVKSIFMKPSFHDHATCVLPLQHVAKEMHELATEGKQQICAGQC